MDGFKRPKRPAQINGVRPDITRSSAPNGPRPVVQAPPRQNAPELAPRPATIQSAPQAQPVQTIKQPVEGQELPIVTTTEVATPIARKKRHIFRTVFLCMLAAIVLGACTTAVWYHYALKPANSSDTIGKDVEIKEAETFTDIAARLQDMGLINNQYAFQLHARFTNQTKVAVGTCVIKASETPDQILAKLAKGCNEFKVITFYPGATIEKPLYKPTGATGDLDSMYIKFRLQKAGYSDAQIEAALNKQYTGPLFADKPAGTSLEGYIYGETYHVDTTASADTVLQTTFDQMYKDIQANDLVAKFKAQGLNLYQGITLSSIVQRELNCEGKPTEERKQRCYGYQQTIAQVFLKRYKEGTTLGSDVTFIYAADMKGVAPTPELDSLYNTRIHPGLPPGPIASPGLLAMEAVGNPSATEYNFFIAGDDGLIYFAKTSAEHESNIAKYCKILCNSL